MFDHDVGPYVSWKTYPYAPVFEHCRVLASRFSVLVFLDSERLYQFGSILLAIHDLVWLSFELLSVSHRTTNIFWKFLFQQSKLRESLPQI